MALKWVRAGIISGLDTLLVDEFSLNASSLKKIFNFDFDLLENSDYQIPLDTVIKLLEDCAIYTNCDYFGALLGHKQESDILGILPSLAGSAQKLGDAIKQIYANLSLNTEGVEWQLAEDEHFAYTTLNILGSHQVNQQQAIYLGAIQAFKIFKSLSNNKWAPSRIYFVHPAPSNVKYLRSTLGTDIYFNMDFNGFIFQKESLELPISSHNKNLNTLINDYLKLTGNAGSVTKLEQIKLSIRSLILLKQNCSLSEIASSQNKTPRAIQYYLKGHGLSYQELLDKVRYELASELLTVSEQPIFVISALVGFADSSVFSRSFKKHVGLTPSKYRSQNKKIGLE